MPDTALRELADDPSSRKRFLKMLGGTGAVSAFSILLAACGDDDDEGGGSAQQPTETSGGGGGAGDLAIVNYALTLEYLEADFYDKVIDSGVVKDARIASLAKSIRDNEREHVSALKATAEQLGGPAAKRPRTNFDEVINAGPKMILSVAADVENLGAAAYLGQAGNIKSKEILAAALAIHTVEARHAAALNEIAGRRFEGDGPLKGSIPDGAFAKPMAMDEVLEQVKPFLAG